MANIGLGGASKIDTHTYPTIFNVHVNPVLLFITLGGPRIATIPELRGGGAGVVTPIRGTSTRRFHHVKAGVYGTLPPPVWAEVI